VWPVGFFVAGFAVRASPEFSAVGFFVSFSHGGSGNFVKKCGALRAKYVAVKI